MKPFPILISSNFQVFEQNLTYSVSTQLQPREVLSSGGSQFLYFYQPEIF